VRRERGEYAVTDEIEAIDLDAVFDFLSSTYWAHIPGARHAPRCL